MNLEKITSPELKNESEINLSSLSFSFWSNDEIKILWEQKIRDLEDKEKWIKENEDKILKNKEVLAVAVESGVIPNSNTETIRKYICDKAKNEIGKIPQIKNELEKRIEYIKKSVSEKLAEFLPSWILDKATVTFGVNEKADYSIDGNNIFVDLGRLISKDNFIRNTVQGITHEVFHIWMGEKTNWSDDKQNEVSDQVLKDRIIFKTIDEGLAVLIGGQSIRNHHESQGKNYKDYIQESFAAFNNFIRSKTKDQLEKIKSEEFKNMGHFYVVGNEIVKTVLEKEGIDNFRKHINEFRENPGKLLEEYKRICANNPKLLKIGEDIFEQPKNPANNIIKEKKDEGLEELEQTTIVLAKLLNEFNEKGKEIEEVIPKERNFDIYLSESEKGIVITLCHKELPKNKDLREFLPSNHKFALGDSFAYDGEEKTVILPKEKMKFRGSILSLSHEIGHSHKKMEHKISKFDTFKAMVEGVTKIIKSISLKKEYNENKNGTIYQVTSLKSDEIIPQWYIDKISRLEAKSERDAWAYALWLLRGLKSEGYDVFAGFENLQQIRTYIDFCLSTYQINAIKTREINKIKSSHPFWKLYNPRFLS